MNLTLLLTAATLVAVAALSILFSRRPAWGLGLFVASLPFERIGSYSLNPATGYPLLHAAQIVGAGLIGGYGLRFLGGRERLKIPRSFWFLAAFFASAVVSAVLARVQEVWQILVWLAFISTLFLVIAQWASRANVRVIRKTMVIAVLVVSIFGLYQLAGDLAGLPTSVTGLRPVYTKSVLGFTRIQSTALEPLYFANYLFLPLFMLLALGSEVGFDGKVEVTALILAFLNFILTLSRGGYVSGAVGLVLLLVLTRQRMLPWLRTHSRAAAATIVTAIVILLVTTTVAIKIAKPGQFSVATALKNFLGTHAFETGSFTARLHDEKLALQIWEKHPVFGVGIGGFGSAYYGCHIGKCVYRPNNQALEVLAEGGVVGFLVFHAFLLALLVYGWQALKKTTGQQRAMIAGLMAAVVAMVVQSQTFSGFLCCLTYTWGTLGLLAGLSSDTGTHKTAKGGRT